LSKPFEILDYQESQLGLLCLRRRDVLSQPGVSVTEVTLNHEFLMSSLYTDSEQALSQIACQMHGGSELRVLVGGLGLGYTAQAALAATQVAEVEVVELLPQVIQWLQDGLIPLAERLLTEIESTQRLTITPGDAYARLAGDPDELFDLILIDVDHSPADRLGDESQPFYTAAGLKAARQHLAPGGVLGVWSYAESSPFAEALHDVFEEVRVEPITHHNDLIDQQHTDWLFFARG